MADNPVWAIYDRVAEVQALLHDHIEGGKHGLTKRISITHTAPAQRASESEFAAGDVRAISRQIRRDILYSLALIGGHDLTH